MALFVYGRLSSQYDAYLNTWESKSIYEWVRPYLAADGINKPPSCIEGRTLLLVRWQHVGTTFTACTSMMMTLLTLSIAAGGHTWQRRRQTTASPLCLLPQRCLEVCLFHPPLPDIWQLRHHGTSSECRATWWHPVPDPCPPLGDHGWAIPIESRRVLQKPSQMFTQPC